MGDLFLVAIDYLSSGECAEQDPWRGGCPRDTDGAENTEIIFLL